MQSTVDIHLKSHTEELEQLARRIVNLKLHTPVLLFLELHKPISSIIYNASLVLAPIAIPLFGANRVHHLQTVFAERSNIEQLMQLIDTYANTH